MNPKRVAERWAYRQKYARLIKAMSMSEAKQILGFPPSAHVTPDEVKKQHKLLSLQSHPDRTQDPALKREYNDKQVQLNVAKDLLLGEGTALRPSRPVPTQEWETPEPPKADEVRKGQTFAEALSDNGPPVNTEWKFVSIPVSYWEASYYPSHTVWTLYGQTHDKIVICSVKKLAASAGPIPVSKGYRVQFEEDWKFSYVTLPLGSNQSRLLKVCQKYLKDVGTGWTDAKPDAPKKYI